MSGLSAHPPVARFELCADGDDLCGYAAPASGARPCVLKLVSDDVPIRFIRAGGFSAEAKDAGIRFGWCGFVVVGLAEAFAIGSRVELRCAATNELLAKIPFVPEILEARSAVERVSAPDVLRAAAASEMAAEMITILPFAIQHRKLFGARELVKASYLTLLGRPPDDDDAEAWEAKVGDDDEAAFLLEKLIDSHEFKDGLRAAIPGPFHHTFRYDRSLLG